MWLGTWFDSRWTFDWIVADDFVWKCYCSKRPSMAAVHHRITAMTRTQTLQIGRFLPPNGEPFVIGLFHLCQWWASFGIFRWRKKKNDAANKSLGWPTGLIGTAQVFLYFYFFFLVLLCRSRRNNHWNAQMERRETQLTGWQVVNCFGGVALSSSLAPHFVASSPCSKERTSHGSEVIRTRKAAAARSLPARMKVNEEERCPICC